MEAAQMEALTSGASGRIIPVFRNLRGAIPSYQSLKQCLNFFYSTFICFLLPFLHRPAPSSSSSASPITPPPSPKSSSLKRRSVRFRVWRDEEDTMRRIALAETLQMAPEIGDGDFIGCRCSTSLFVGGALLEKVRLENPGIPCFLFGHSTGGAVVLKAASYSRIEQMVEGIILTSPALCVKPAHPVVGVIAPFFSLIVPRFQFKGANKRGIPVSRDPVQLAAKYSDPLVYTGPIRVRTGHEILRISSHLTRSFKSVTVPFFVLHGTADRVTDPLASQDLYNEAASYFKDIKLYDGFLHDLLFEPEREEIGRDIINWMEKRLAAFP